MKPLSQLMTDMIAMAEDIVRTPVSTVPVAFYALAAEIRRAHALPAEARRCTHAVAAVLELVEGLCAAQRAGDVARMPWLMLIGAALPLLRAEAYAQFCQEKEAHRS